MLEGALFHIQTFMLRLSKQMERLAKCVVLYTTDMFLKSVLGPTTLALSATTKHSFIVILG